MESLIGLHMEKRNGRLDPIKEIRRFVQKDRGTFGGLFRRLLLTSTGNDHVMIWGRSAQNGIDGRRLKDRRIPPPSQIAFKGI